MTGEAEDKPKGDAEGMALPEADAVDQGIRRALDAAAAANEAAQDMADLSAAHRAFAEAVIAGQKRNTMLAAGAAAGAAVAVLLSGLVYFRSVEDLRIAAAVQTDAAKLLVEEVKQIDGIGDTVEEQQAVMKADLLATLELVKDEVRRAAMAAVTPEPEPEPDAGEMAAELTTALREGMKTDLDMLRDEILMALAEVDLGGAADPAMAELLAGVKALVAAQGDTAAARPQARPATAPARASGAAPAAPRASRITPPPAEPNPFTYP